MKQHALTHKGEPGGCKTQSHTPDSQHSQNGSFSRGASPHSDNSRGASGEEHHTAKEKRSRENSGSQRFEPNLPPSSLASLMAVEASLKRSPPEAQDMPLPKRAHGKSLHKPFFCR